MAEVNRQVKAAERRQRQAAAAATRAQVAAARDAERTRREWERAQAAAARLSAAEAKAAEKEMARIHVEMRQAEAMARNSELAAEYAEIDGLLAMTLAVDDYIDLELLKTIDVAHPPFDPGPLGETAIPGPETAYPPEPLYSDPPAPNGLSAAFGGRKRHEAAIERVRAEHSAAHRAWQEKCRTVDRHRRAFEEAEADRLARLEEARTAYQEACRAREEEAQVNNAEIDQLKTGLAFDVPEAIEEYVSLVLSNSIYPESFPVTHQGTFDLTTRELTVLVSVPEPSAIPTVKEYRYVKAKDEITASSLPLRAQKERYAGAIWQVAVRTLHEVFEADRAEKIRSIALTVGVPRRAPATGHEEVVPLVVAAAARETFQQFDLANVIPMATLQHLGAALSTSPFDLKPAGTTGVRTRSDR